jgi:hypothetical protein
VSVIRIRSWNAKEPPRGGSSMLLGSEGNYGREILSAPAAPWVVGQPQRREGIIEATSPAVRVQIIVAVPYPPGRICRCEP